MKTDAKEEQKAAPEGPAGETKEQRTERRKAEALEQPRRPLTEATAYYIAWVLMWIYSKLYFRLEVIGAENIPRGGACILASNHASSLDPPLMSMATTRRVQFWAKAELLNVPLLAAFLRAIRVIPVHRGQPDRKALRRAFEALDLEMILLIFPEGTRTETGELQRGERGTGMIWAKRQVPLVPAYIEGTYEAMPRGVFFPRPRKVRIVVGRPVLPPPDFRLDTGSGDYYQDLADYIMRRIRALQAHA